MLPTPASPQPDSDCNGIAADREQAGRPRVLVLLATYNGSRWIREQVESILQQQAVDLTIAIRDDASTDGTRWELARFEHDPRVRITAATAPGGSAAGNFLALIRENPASAFDLVAFADQDDLWNPDKLRRAGELLAASGGAAGYSSATVARWEDGRERLLKLSGAPTTSDFLFEGAGQGCTFVLTAEFYERVRRFLLDHENLTRGVHYHDWMVYALARSWGLGWCFDARPSMQYRQHARNDTGGRGTVGGVTRRLTLIRNGWYGTQLRAIAEVCRTAAPSNATILAWHRMLIRADGVRKRMATARLCLSGGRRRTRDNAIVVLAALCGWI
jgi:rhamnosyltransferase